ncbi:MAG: glycosyltransferase [Patescibacteria group bacterium]|nr:glycosyltransferase [Patescibacteria group bacterium]
MIKYSFIIPVKAINDYVREAISKILAIKRDDYEIIVYPDQTNDEQWEKTRQIACLGGPAIKRTRSITDASGEILIFIDDDAFPAENYLEILDEDFKDEKIKAAGGPAITPPDDGFWQKVSGAVFLSFYSGGNPERYISRGGKVFVADWPSVNFTIRKAVFAELGGFASEFWPGEDTKLCHDLNKKYPQSIVYDPALIVYHHRRSGLREHLRQTGAYGLHRGYFVKHYPETSFKLKYFLPALFLLFAVFGAVLSLADIPFSAIYLLGWLIYVLVLFKSISDIRHHEKNSLIILNAVYYIFLTHLVYGFYFIKGLVFTRNLKSKLR